MEVARRHQGHDSRQSNGGSVVANRVDFAVRRQLRLELDSAVAFADYCSYLGGGALAGQAEQFVAMAESLYEATVASLHPRPPS
jgi:hypothetical protein